MQADLGAFGLLTADARILQADNGAEIAVGDLVRSGKRPAVGLLTHVGVWRRAKSPLCSR
jgi:hypothetical protein